MLQNSCDDADEGLDLSSQNQSKTKKTVHSQNQDKTKQKKRGSLRSRARTGYGLRGEVLALRGARAMVNKKHNKLPLNSLGSHLQFGDGAHDSFHVTIVILHTSLAGVPVPAGSSIA
jgi:hypothetical protein